MVVGAVMVGACLLVLGWASEVAGVFVVDEKAVCRLHRLPIRRSTNISVRGNRLQ